MNWPNRVWYFTGNGWASREPTKEDKERRGEAEKEHREKLIRRAASK